jgi:hypothetical protein
VASVRAAWDDEKLGPLLPRLRAVEDGQVVGEGGESP